MVITDRSNRLPKKHAVAYLEILSGEHDQYTYIFFGLLWGGPWPYLPKFNVSKVKIFSAGGGGHGPMPP